LTLSRLLAAAAVITTAGALAAVTTASVSEPISLVADVGRDDSHAISLTNEAGAPVGSLAPGTYTIEVHDRSTIHNFRLSGPGVDRVTSVLGTGDFTWTVTLTDGYYRYVCDPHVATMHGDFVVGNGRRQLSASVGPGRAVGLRDVFGLKVTKLTAGAYVVTVRDRSTKDNFRLRGPGTNRATGITFRGAARWTLTLKAGTYTYSSDATKKLRRSVLVSEWPWGP
jgi:plastocyanin